MMFANCFGRYPVELESLGVLSRNIIKPPDLEGDVLVLIQHEIIRPYPRNSPEEVILQLRAVVRYLIQNDVPELRQPSESGAAK